MNQVVVIGGGVAGLASSALLAREGYRVRLLEKGARVGGRVGSVQRDGFLFDTGPSWFLMPEVFNHYYELLGTSLEEQLDLTTLEPGYQVFGEPDHEGQVNLVTIPHVSAAVMDVFEDLESGSGQNLREYLASANRALDMAVRYFLYNPFTRLRSLLSLPILKSAWTLLSLLRTPLEKFVNTRFQHPVLRQVLAYHAVFLGTDPRQAPAVYHLMSALDLVEGVQYPMGGFRQLITSLESLARKEGVDIVTGADVTEIVTSPQGRKSRVTGVTWRDEQGQLHVEDADIVVSGADLHHTETALLPERARSYPETWWQKKQSGPGAVVVLLGVKGNIPQLEHHALFFTGDWHANFDAIFGDVRKVPDPTSLYVCKPSHSDPTVAPADHENLFILIPVPADTGIGAGGIDGAGDPQVEQIADSAIRQVETWAGMTNLKDRIVYRQTLGPADFANQYNSWQGGMLGPSHILRQSAMFRAQNQSKRVHGLYYAGATTAPGVGLPMCLISAELVLKRIRGDHSAGPITIHPSSKSRPQSPTARGR